MFGLEELQMVFVNDLCGNAHPFLPAWATDFFLNHVP